ncbi:MAG: hypothetical protein KAI66_03070, partial [Lentisphaeria bacterium]|nr:hypothetical protein [Lentisphaeria bacterium]
MVALLLATTCAWAAPTLKLPSAKPVAIHNASFTEGMVKGVPKGWRAYKRADERRRREIMSVDSGPALKLIDGDDTREIGVAQTFPIKPGLYYRLSARARGVEGVDSRGFFLQLRFLPSGQLSQTALSVRDASAATESVVGGMAPADTTQATIYIYSSRDDTPTIIVEEVSLTAAPATVFASVTEPTRLVRGTVLTQGGKATAQIIAPANPKWQAVAQQLANALHERTGSTFPVQTADTITVDSLRQSTAILLGNVFNNHLLLHAYTHSLVFADGAYPGPGGYDVRTVHDPWGTGHNLLSLGAIDADGVLNAVSALLPKLPTGPDAILPPCHEVKLTGVPAKLWGSWFRAKLGERWVQAQKKRAEDGLANGIHGGLFTLAKDYGQRYAVTRREEYARMFVWLIQRAQSHHDSKPTTYGGPWGMDSDFRIYSVIPLWDAVEECPALSDEERMQVTRILYQWVCDLDHKGRAHGDDVRFNHTTFPALGCMYAGQYFASHYDDVLQARLWLQQAHEVFRFQARTTKAHCDCNSYHWLPLDHTSKYALATGDLTYFENGNVRTMAD